MNQLSKDIVIEYGDKYNEYYNKLELHGGYYDSQLVYLNWLVYIWNVINTNIETGVIIP